jgi:hypothetical protein
MALFGRKTPKRDPYQESLDRAVPASATVVAGRQTTHTSQDVNSHSELFEVELDVLFGEVDPMRVIVFWTVFDVALPDIRSGVELAVTVDPEVPGLVYPPGYPPPGTKPGVISLRDARILPGSKWLGELLD